MELRVKRGCGDVRAAQCGIWSADICTADIRSHPEFAAVAIHLLKGPFVASGSLMAHGPLTCTAFLFIYFALLRVGFPPRFSSIAGGREEEEGGGGGITVPKAILLLRVSRGVSAPRRTVALLNAGEKKEKKSSASALITG